jgi:transcriptional regulator with XRE-family HTH domain
MENGEYKVGLDTLFRILQVFELSMSRFFEEPTPAEGVPDVEETPSAGDQEREKLLSDWSELPDEGRRDVLEFVAFKRMQIRSRKPRWKPEPGPDEPKVAVPGAGSEGEEPVDA